MIPTGSKKNILIVDKDAVLLRTFVGLLKSQGGFIKVLSAQSGPEALDILKREPVHIVITGISLPEIDGFELLTLITRGYPEIRVIMMTHNASPMLRAKIKQTPAAFHVDPTVDMSMLTKRIFTELQIDYGGQIRGLSLSSFLQMVKMEGHSCTLHVSGKGKTGYLHLTDGELIAASHGPLKGEAAAIQILSWDNVEIDIDYTKKDLKREIEKPFMALLLESGRMTDEIMGGRPDLRKHERFECLVAIDYDISDLTYQCFLRDISLGGAYIETEQAIEVGQQIILTLNSPEQKQSTIKARVARKDKKGIGVKFDDLDEMQKKVIEELSKGIFRSSHASE